MSFISLRELEERQPVPGFRARFVHSEQMTVAHWQIDKGAVMPEHAHHHEQIVNVIEGELALVVAGEEKTMTAGDVAIIPSNALHSGVARTACRVIDVFHPTREDYS
jgi:quercetin dioxygenase-like cupin family protein